MNRNSLFLFFSLALMAALIAKPVFAQPKHETINTPQQLINAVNALRASRGLSVLVEHSALMQSAQSQANYMAATGNITHERPGTSYTQQLLALGFPLAGDLSLGGFRSENILSSGSPLVWDGVPPGWQDDLHMNTMISVNYTHIGAGIAQRGGAYYYAVDAAAATSSGQMPEQAADMLTNIPDGANVTGASQYIIPVEVNAAQSSGEVYHVVEYGQTLWAIAIAYNTKIKEIQALNYLGESTVVQQGQKLLVMRGATQPAPPTWTAAAMTTAAPMMVTVTPFIVLSPTFALSPPVEIETPAPTPPVASDTSSRVWVATLIIASLVGGGVAVWLIRDPNS